MNEMLITLLQVRNQCLATVTKIIHFSEPKALGEQLGDLPISSFIAGLLTQKDMTTVAKALQLAEILMHKLPGIFSKYFLKEGVVHAVEQLAASAPQLAGEEKAKSKAAKRASQRLKVSHKTNLNTTSLWISIDTIWHAVQSSFCAS
jgi:E3 ubiquitin-protein ligase TRIP12